jgi:hypothetical protein
VLFTVSPTGGFYRKPYSTLVLNIHTKKSTKQKELESLHEKHFVERKNEGRKPDKNSSLRRLEFVPRAETSTKNAVQEFHLRVGRVPRTGRAV